MAINKRNYTAKFITGLTITSSLVIQKLFNAVFITGQTITNQVYFTLTDLSNWILLNGIWHDIGQWNDTELWTD
jgi:hypothetical protein